MQTPVQPQPQSVYQPPQRPRRGPWLAIGLTCGGCALVMLLVGLVIANGLRDALKHSPPPLSYVGTWRHEIGPATTTVAIAADGAAGYRFISAGPGTSMHSSVNGYARIEEKDNKLFIGIGRIGKSFRIAAPPHPANGAMEMTLDGDTFQRIGDYEPLPNSD